MRSFSRPVLFLIFVFLQILLADFTNLAAKENFQSIENDYSAENTLGFIKHLVSKNEYYRAFVELKRLDSYYPGYLKEDKIFASELFMLFKGCQYPEIFSKDFQGIDRNTRAIHSIFKTDACIEKSEFIRAKELAEAAGFTGYNKDINLFIYKRMVLSYLLLNMIDEAKKIIDNRDISFDAGPDNIEFGELAEYSADYYKSFKKPYNAVIFGIIPGMGYVYAGQRATGIIAFLLVSALSTLTYYSFKTNNKPIGIFVGTAATFFYGGSIIGGYLSAGRYNNSAVRDLKDSLSEKLYLNKDRERIFNGYGAGSAGK